MLITLLRMAARNIFRNTRRSMLTAFVIIITSSAIVSGKGLLNGTTQALVDSVTQTVTGDAQVHAEGYLKAKEALPLDKVLAWDDAIDAELRQDKAVVEVSGRIAFAGLISDPETDQNTAFYGLGLDPDHEPVITPANFDRVLEGQPLSNDDPWGVVIGRALATGLKVGVGDEVTLLVNTKSGSLNGKDVLVRGIAHLQLPGLANKAVQMPLASAQKLLRMGDVVTEIAIKIEPADMPSVTAYGNRLQKSIPVNHPGLETNTWMDTSSGFLDVFAMWNSVFDVFVAVFYIMMVSGIINTVLMSIFERTTEIGMMMAIGVRRKRIVHLFLMEGLLLASIGSLLGSILGIGLVAYYHNAGFPLALAGDLPKVIYPQIEMAFVLKTIAGAHVVALFSALVPTLRAARMTPVEALADS